MIRKNTIIMAETRKAVFTALYEASFPAVARYIAQRGGTLEEAEDVFQDTLLVYYEKARGGLLHLERGEKEYIFGVSRYLWAKRYRENMRYTSLDEMVAAYDRRDSEPGWAELPEPQIAHSRMIRVLQTAGQKCMQLLSAFYYEKLDMDDLATRFGFSGKRSATVQKFKCLQKVKQLVKEKSLQYEDFVE
ncbi:RNA polymerase sigma factor [Parapedobacter sp. 10938]|uniref:RNA polymerase sigma factor n=1 Tax=Parapedobacter flavus TaxID=3110225 RepID=UPI002DB713C8|nr:sigma-70 family RNA polymerase sigma factor [Parapedobacter sp. 10938]MEC3881758.1 sigma-70 family RNA polymerase sigma factor [Parapedobacter sp. 10938]